MLKRHAFYPKVRLCLCLLPALLLASCGAKQQMVSNSNPQTWDLQAILLPGYCGPDTFPFSFGSTASFRVFERPHQLIVCYRIYNPVQLEQVREVLLATGMVEHINIIPHK